MFEKVKAGLGLSSKPLPLIQAYQVLKAAPPGLYDAVLGYIADGQGPEVLTRVAQAPDPIRRLLGTYLGGYLWWQDDQQKAVAKAVPGWTSAKQREAAEALLTHPAVLTAEQWVRLGRFTAAYGDLDLKRLPDVPAWLAHLWTAQGQTCREAPWTAAFVAGLVAADGTPPAEVPVLVTRIYLEGGAGYYTTLRPMPGAAEHLVEAPDTFRAAVSRASLEGKLNALDVVTATPGLGERVPDVLRDLALSSSKQVREKALNVMSGLPEPIRNAALAEALEMGSPANVAGVAALLARSEAGRRILEARLPGASGKLADTITAALQRSEAAATPSAAAETPLVVPFAPPLDRRLLGDEFDTQLRAALPAWIERLRSQAADLRGLAKPYPWQKDRLKRAESTIEAASRLGDGDLRRLRDYLNGATPSVPNTVRLLEDVLRQVKGLGLLPSMRLCLRSGKGPVSLSWYELRERFDIDLDLRALREAAALVGVADPDAGMTELAFGWYGRDISPENKWPYLVEHPERLEQALGLRPSPAGVHFGGTDDVAAAIEILDAFPVLPSAYVPRLAEIALGTGKTNRAEAQRLLAKHSRAGLLATQGLSDSSSEVRASAAAWLASLGDPDAIADLRARLAIERNEPVQAAILSALSRLGDDISSFVTPAALAAAAAKGLKGKPPADMEWVPMLPAVRWSDGTPADADTIRWWATLAVKMKDPAGAGLIPIYVRLLDDESQQALGRFVLDAWIAQDTRTATDEEARAYASVEGPKRYQQYQDWYARSKNDYAKERAGLTRDQVFEEVRKEKLGEFLGSAIGSKGLLALTCGAPGHHVLQSVQRYIRDYGQRRSQVEALVTAAAANDDPSAIQLVLQVARRFKQATVQAKAQELVAALAERKGWTADELADRTVPTAGFEDDGLLTLDYGPRQFIGRIGQDTKTGAYGLSLATPDGKPVKALPAPASSDDPDLAKQARAQLSVTKKELKQIVDLQTARLFEAMCTGRTWDAASWRDDLLAHPVMKHLLSGLVWVANPGTPARRLFRPTVEGDLVDAVDDVVALDDDAARVGLAHASTMTPAEVTAWQQHLADYQVMPLFGQFATGAPAFTPGATEISDHRGWLSDSFTIRGRATKRGYARSQAEDGGWFGEYVRTYTSVGIKTVIAFTGSYLPEEQIAAAITDLSFEATTGRSRKLPLEEVPPVLLAESHRDYVFVAEGGVFDPDWQNKAAF